MWERGLKWLTKALGRRLTEVAPRVGAWIEMGILSVSLNFGMSLPVWERGLKSLLDTIKRPHGWSFPIMTERHLVKL